MAKKKISRKVFDKEMKRLQAELCALQDWVVRQKLKVAVVFEGRDAAGKGGIIKCITERVSPRVFKVIALPAPTERQKTQIYAQRYMKHLPSGGDQEQLEGAARAMRELLDYLERNPEAILQGKDQ